jgi:hypothetical protein
VGRTWSLCGECIPATLDLGCAPHSIGECTPVAGSNCLQPLVMAELTVVRLCLWLTLGVEPGGRRHPTLDGTLAVAPQDSSATEMAGRMDAAGGLPRALAQLQGSATSFPLYELPPEGTTCVSSSPTVGGVPGLMGASVQAPLWTPLRLSSPPPRSYSVNTGSHGAPGPQRNFQSHWFVRAQGGLLMFVPEPHGSVRPWRTCHGSLLPRAPQMAPLGELRPLLSQAFWPAGSLKTQGPGR